MLTQPTGAGGFLSSNRRGDAERNGPPFHTKAYNLPLTSALLSRSFVPHTVKLALQLTEQRFPGLCISFAVPGGKQSCQQAGQVQLPSGEIEACGVSVSDDICACEGEFGIHVRVFSVPQTQM